MAKKTPRTADDLQLFALRLRAVRMEKGLTQEQVARGSGIDRTVVVRIEGGHRPPRFHQLVALHKALGVPRGSLLSA